MTFAYFSQAVNSRTIESLLFTLFFMAGLFSSLSPLAIILAAVAGQIIGALWYSPLLFGKQWMKLSGVTQKDIDGAKGKMGPAYLMAFIGAIVMAIVLALVFGWSSVDSFGQAFIVTVLLWAGFTLPVHLGQILWGGKPAGLFFLNGAYQIVMMVIMALILVLV